MLSPPQVKYSAREFLKSGSPSTAAYPTRAEDPTDFKYALMSRAAALTKATFCQSNFKENGTMDARAALVLDARLITSFPTL